MACTIDCDSSDGYPLNGQLMTLVNTVGEIHFPCL